MKLHIRQERINRGWTQEFVGCKTGITPEGICMIEAGKRKPSYEVLIKLEDLFEMNHRELFAPVPDDIEG